MKMKLDHIGLVVADIEEYAGLFRLLGLGEATEAVADATQKVSGSFIAVTGEDPVYIELLEATQETSPVVNFLRKRGGGLHHLCFEVEDIEEARDRLVEKGFRLVNEVEPCEAYDLNLKRQCATPTKAAFFMVGRLLLELFEKGR